MSASQNELSKKEKITLLKRLIESEDAFSHNQSIYQAYLFDPDPEVRVLAIQGLWDYPDPALIESLIEIAERDPEQQVRNRAITALGRYVHEGEMADYDFDWGAMEDVIREDELPEESFRRVMAFLLGLAQDPSSSPDARRFSIEALGFSSAPEVADLVMQAYHDPLVDMKVSAIFAMGRSGLAQWVPYVLDELDSPEPRLQLEAVKIPAPVKQVDEPHAFLNQPPGQQAVVGKTRTTWCGPIGLKGLFRFSGNIHHFRHTRLHPVGQFILGDAGDGLRVPQFLGLQLVEVIEGIQTLPPQLPIHTRRIRDEEDRVALGATLHALVDTRQEARPETAGAPVGLHPGGDQHDKAGQVGVFTAEAIGNPASQARPASPGTARVNQKFSRCMVELIGVHTPHQAEFVGNPVQMRNRIGEFHSTLTAAFPLPPRAQQFGGPTSEGELLTRNGLSRTIFAIPPEQFRLVIVEIEVWRGAGQVNHNHPLGPRRKLRWPHRQWIGQ